MCIYTNQARQQENKQVTGTYTAYLKAKEAYPDKVIFFNYV